MSLSSSVAGPLQQHVPHCLSLFCQALASIQTTFGFPWLYVHVSELSGLAGDARSFQITICLQSQVRPTYGTVLHPQGCLRHDKRHIQVPDFTAVMGYASHAVVLLLLHKAIQSRMNADQQRGILKVSILA